MQEAEEQDTCRICSGPAEENQPLFHPCKCSGTIRYIHQDCLTTWLAHSNKKSCDVCKHPYSFTKVYADDMPSTLPPLLVLRRLIQQLFVGIFFVLRAIMVGTIWLAVLPYATVRTWRMYFFMGDAAAWWISNVQRPAVNATAPIYATSSTPQTTKSAATTLFGHLSTHPAWLALSADIFMGQIIASLIVLTFVAIFLLREWISQNARPGIFEDEELPPPDPNRPQVPQQGRRAVRVPVDQQQLQAALARRQVETMRALDEMRARDGVHGHLVGDERTHGRTPLERPPRKKREDGQAAFDSRATRRLLAPQNHGDYGEEDGAYDPEDERQRRHSFSRRVFAARVAGARRKAALAAAGQPPIVPAVPGASRFEFNFRRPEDSDSNDDAVPPSATPSTSQAPNLSAILPPVILDPPKDNIPFSLGPFASAPPFSLTASTPGLVQTSPNGTSIGVPFHPPLSVTNSEPSLPLPPPYSEEDMNPPSPLPASPTTLNAVLEPRPPQVFNFTISDADAGPSHPPIQGPPEPSPSGSLANGKVKAEILDDDEELGGSMSDYFTSDLEDEDRIKEEQEVTEEGDETLVPKDEDAEDLPAHDEDDDGQEHESEEDEDADGEEQHEIDSDDSEDEEDDDDNPWRPVEVRAVPAQNGANRPGNAAGAPAAAPANAAAAADGGLQEDIQPDVEDDMEGAMEAIGMRGPLHGVLQNAALMIFVLDTAIGLGIFVPFTIGKLTALLSLNPPRFFQILHLPIKAIRVVTDPVVDGIAYVLVHFLLPPLIRTTKSSAGPFIERYLPFLNASPREITPANNSTNFVTVFTSRLTEFATTSYEKISAWSLALPTEPPLEESTISKYSAQVWDKAEPYFAILGKHVRLSSDRFKVSWVKMSIGGGPAERTFAILLGYVVAGFALAIYLNLLTVGNAKSANRAIRSAVRQQLLVLKVAAFIFIELVTFPLTCGIILDLCTVVFFPSAPLNSRMVFFKQAPLTAVFYHWVAGTMFMYTFAIVLSGCRSVMRVGAMWFIKDPQDQNSHPIRDILDRPTFTQLKKISISGCMYAVVVACFVGSMSILLSLGKLSILPFRWKNREPISDVPVDLLFLHMVLPYTMQYFRPKKPLRKFSTFLWKWLASRLRLTSYFFGDRTADEEKATSWWRVISTKPPTTKDTDGTFRRVPATDSVALPRDMRATVEVSAYGMAINEEAQILMNKQNAEVLKAKKRITDEFIVVYMPPYFRYRIFVFIACLWVIGIAVLGASIAVPISLGRSFFQIFTPKELHDGYSLIVGFYITWAAYLIVAWIDRLDKRRKRSEGSRTADLPLLVAKRGLAWAAKVGFMGFWLGVVIPTLIATVVDLYIITPIRLQLQPDWVPTVRVVDNWALGLLYTKIALHVTRIRRLARNGQGQERVYELPTRISEGVQHLINNGWTQPDPIQASREVILPMVGGLSAMILFPGAILRGIQYFMPHVKFGNRFLFDKVYPLIFAFAGLARSAVVLDEKVASWSQTIRDKEFLVEMRLRNHEPEREGSSSSAESIRTDTSGANEN